MAIYHVIGFTYFELWEYMLLGYTLFVRRHIFLKSEASSADGSTLLRLSVLDLHCGSNLRPVHFLGSMIQK